MSTSFLENVSGWAGKDGRNHVQSLAMEGFAEKLKNFRNAAGKSQPQLAAEIGVSYQTVSDWENGKSEPRGYRRGRLAKALGISEGELFGDEPTDDLPPGFDHDPRMKPAHEKSSWIPRIGRVAAGKITDFELNVLGDPDIPGTLYPHPDEFPATVVADGESMSGLIEHGDIVAIARRYWRAPQSGDIVAVSLTQERGSTIKWLEIMPDGRWKLTPQNKKAGPPVTYDRDEIKSAAVVVGWYHQHAKERGRR